LNGFLPHIAQHVVSMKPDSLDTVLEAARVAELTNPTKSATEEVLTEQLADVRAELKVLASKWEENLRRPQSLIDSSRLEDHHHPVKKSLSHHRANSHQSQVLDKIIITFEPIMLPGQHLLKTEHYRDLVHALGSQVQRLHLLRQCRGRQQEIYL